MSSFAVYDYNNNLMSVDVIGTKKQAIIYELDGETRQEDITPYEFRDPAEVLPILKKLRLRLSDGSLRIQTNESLLRYMYKKRMIQKTEKEKEESFIEDFYEPFEEPKRTKKVEKTEEIDPTNFLLLFSLGIVTGIIQTFAL